MTLTPPSLPPADLDAYRASLATILDTYRPEVLVVENEENSALFYQGTPAEYAAQLAVACAVAHERGVLCVNGRLTGGLAALLLYDHYRRAGDEARAEDFRARAFTAEQRVLLDTPRAQEQLNRGRELLARYQTVGVDYLNVHWYGADPAALVEVVEHLRAETGLPVLSNEVGQWNDDPAQTTAIMAAIARIGLPIAVWFSVDGPRSRALVEPDGTLRPTGRAFQAFIARGMGEAPPSENPWGVSFGALVLDPVRTPRALELAARPVSAGCGPPLATAVSPVRTATTCLRRMTPWSAKRVRRGCRCSARWGWRPSGTPPPCRAPRTPFATRRAMRTRLPSTWRARWPAIRTFSTGSCGTSPTYPAAGTAPRRSTPACWPAPTRR